MPSCSASLTALRSICRTASATHTPLHLATREDQAEIVAVLVDAGASLDVTNVDGQTAVDLAGTDEIADLFRDVGDVP